MLLRPSVFRVSVPCCFLVTVTVTSKKTTRNSHMEDRGTKEHEFEFEFEFIYIP
jgi:hypothetical protein